MELDNTSHPLRSGRQESSPEMQAPIFLAEPGTRHHADAGSLQQLHAVKLIRGPSLSSSSGRGLVGQSNSGEQVHAPLRSAALDSFHLFKSLVQSRSALLQAIENSIVLLLIKLVRRLTGLGRVDHQLDQALSNNRRAKHDAHKLVNLLLNSRVESYQLEIPTAVTTLAHHTLGDGVERGELYMVVLAWVFFLELTQHPLERDEFPYEDVGLVDLIGEDHETFLAGVVDHGSDVFLWQRGTGGVTGVDNDDGADIDAFGFGFLVSGLDD